MKKGLTLSIGFEDASRSDSDFIVHLMKKLYEDGIRRFRYADTISILNPQTIQEKMTYITGKVPGDIEMEVHCHNDFGLATANTLTALTSGGKMGQYHYYWIRRKGRKCCFGRSYYGMASFIRGKRWD